MFTQSSSLGLQIAFLIGITLPLSSERLSNPRTRLSKTSFLNLNFYSLLLFRRPLPPPSGGLALLRPRLPGRSPRPDIPGRGPAPLRLSGRAGWWGALQAAQAVPLTDTRIPRAAGRWALIIRRLAHRAQGRPAPRVFADRGVGAGFWAPFTAGPAPRVPEWCSGHTGVMRPQAVRSGDPGTLGTDTRDPIPAGPFRSRDLGWGRGEKGAKPAKQSSLLISPGNKEAASSRGELDKKGSRYPFQHN